MKYSAYAAMLSTLFLFAITWGIPVEAAEQQDEFRLNVYGMYCNQCAYGLEQALQHTDGVTDAIIDLKNNSAVVKVIPLSPPAAETLVEKAIDQRLSVKKIEATLTGRVERTADGWALTCGSQRFSLVVDEGPVKLEELTDQYITLDGVFDGIEGVDAAAGRPRFIVRAIRG